MGVWGSKASEGATGEEATGRLDAPGVITCCTRTVMRYPWRPADVGGRPPIFDVDQPMRIPATALEDAMVLADLATRAMRMSEG
jgi:hypothetical protein